MLLTVFFAIGIIIALIISYNSRKIRKWTYNSSSFILFIGIFVYFIVFGFAKCIYNENHGNIIEYEDLEIVSLQNIQTYTIDGVFILGTGGFSGGTATCYITYGKFPEGLKKLELRDDRYYIKENDNIKPCIPNYWKVIIKKPYKSKWIWNRKKESKYKIENYSAKTIVVPKNTIFKEYNIKY